MSEQTSETNSADDPFSPENIGVVHFIQLGRIYDVLMGIFSTIDKDKAHDLLEIHSKGAFMGPEPRFSGNFITDEINVDE